MGILWSILETVCEVVEKTCSGGNHSEKYDEEDDNGRSCRSVHGYKAYPSNDGSSSSDYHESQSQDYCGPNGES